MNKGYLKVIILSAWFLPSSLLSLCALFVFVLLVLALIIAAVLRGYCVWLYCSESKVKERGRGVKLVTEPSRASAQQERWCLLFCVRRNVQSAARACKGLRSARLKLSIAFFRDACILTPQHWWAGPTVTSASTTGLKVSNNLGRAMGPMNDHAQASMSQLSRTIFLSLGAQALCFL